MSIPDKSEILPTLSTLPRKKKVPAKKKSPTSNLESAVRTPKSSKKSETNSKSETKSAKTQRKISQTQECNSSQSASGKDKCKSARGRGKNRGRGRGGNAMRGRVKKPSKNLHYWSTTPPTAQQLAALGAEDGCSYVLATKGKLGARNRAFIAESRSTMEAEIAVANLYDSD